MGGQGRIIDVTAFGTEKRALEHLGGLIKKLGIFRPSHRPKLMQIINRHRLIDPFVTPLFVLHPHGIVMFLDFTPVMPLGFEQNRTGIHIFGQAFFIIYMTQVILPFLPVFETLVSHGHTVLGGVMGPDDGAGCGGGAFTGIRQLVDIERLITHLGQLIGNGTPDNARPDDDHIILFSHDKTSLYIILTQVDSSTWALDYIFQ